MTSYTTFFLSSLLVVESDLLRSQDIYPAVLYRVCFSPQSIVSTVFEYKSIVSLVGGLSKMMGRMVVLFFLALLQLAVNPIAAMAAYGYCSRCQEPHTIPTTDAAKKHARILRETLESTHRLDFDSDDSDNGDTTTSSGIHTTMNKHNPLLDVACLHEGRGKMFGVLVAEDPNTGHEVVLKAFAGKIRSYGWQLDGWVDPIVVPEQIPRFVELRDSVSQVSLEMDQCRQQEQEWNRLKRIRTEMSREALAVLRSEQKVVNFRGESSTLDDIFTTPGKMPVGTGECCATKLVAAASSRNLQPTGIAEFFLGKSKHRRVEDGLFYDSCEARCEKVLGFMLCGSCQH